MGNNIKKEKYALDRYAALETELTPREKQEYWDIAIGLQKVDNLSPSEYLYKQIERNVYHDEDLSSVEENLKSYYENLPRQKPDEYECDLVSTKIVKYLQEAEFILHPLTLKKIHRSIFEDFPEIHPGEYKKKNYGKGEYILNGYSVHYGDYDTIDDFLAYDFDKEKRKSYAQMDRDDLVDSITDFISGIWGIHPFEEGNTRTISVFTIQYLNTMGFSIDNTPFKENSVYFRDALVRANFSDIVTGVDREPIYLKEFFEAILYNEKRDLDSDRLIVRELFREQNVVESKRKELDFEL